MSQTQSFKDLIVWQSAKRFAVEIYKLTARLSDYGFRDQIQRASVSIMNNIAEGHARRSDRSFKHFLSIAKGSAAEVESMLILAVPLGFVEASKQKELSGNIQEISKMLSGLMKKL